MRRRWLEVRGKRARCSIPSQSDNPSEICNVSVEFTLYHHQRMQGKSEKVVAGSQRTYLSKISTSVLTLILIFNPHVRPTPAGSSQEKAKSWGLCCSSLQICWVEVDGLFTRRFPLPARTNWNRPGSHWRRFAGHSRKERRGKEQDWEKFLTLILYRLNYHVLYSFDCLRSRLYSALVLHSSSHSPAQPWSCTKCSRVSRMTCCSYWSWPRFAHPRSHSCDRGV